MREVVARVGQVPAHAALVPAEGIGKRASEYPMSAVASFELEQVQDGDPEVAVVAIAGELDLSNADDLVEQLGTAAAGRPLVVDLNRVLFIDSAALHRLFGVARERGFDRLALVADPSAPVARTLEIVQFHRAATVAASVSDARVALARRA
jgi:anti-anti-sigma factor